MATEAVTQEPVEQVYLDLLRRLEFVQPFSNSNPECVICGGRKHLGHEPGCELEQAIRDADRRAEPPPEPETAAGMQLAATLYLENRWSKEDADSVVVAVEREAALVALVEEAR